MQNSGTTKNLRSVKFINRWTGWTVGDNSTILKTTNGGLNWINVINPTSGKPLHMVSVIDSNYLYVVGSFSTILKSTNGGINWSVIMNWPIGQGNTYQGVFFLNKDTGWACGQGESNFGQVLFTKDGFQSFDSSYTLGAYHADIYFKDVNIGILVGNNGEPYYTTNSGKNWYLSNLQLYGIISFFYRVSFINNYTGWIPGGEGRIFKTTDFGLNWDSISYISLPPQQLLYCIKFINNSTGWCGGTNGVFYKSTNGGITWQLENSLDQRFIRDIFMYDSLTGWCVGGLGKILHTTTGGTSSISNRNKFTDNNYCLEQNYPNPFNSTTIIQFQVPSSKFVKVVVYDLLGREVRTLVNEYKPAGTYEVRFDASELTSGIYYYTLVTDKFRESKIMILLK
jgi:photosystem II stability/assembly factor-like uncharacterized protein